MRCKWTFLTAGNGGTLTFRCRVCRQQIHFGEGDPSEVLARTGECAGRPEDSPPAFRLRSRVRGYMLVMKRWAGWG